MKNRKIAIVNDWLTTYAGSEKVLEQIISLFPEADLFSLVDFLPEEFRFVLGKDGKPVSTSFIHNLPFARNHFRKYLGLMPLAIEQFDLSEYDLILSSSHAVAKGVVTGPNQLHICYCHTPIRYAWEFQYQYLRQAHLERGFKSALARAQLHYLRLWDYRTAQGVDKFIANSSYIARRIAKHYRRDAQVIYPPIDTTKFTLCDKKEDFYLTVSRLVPYKRIDLIVEAFGKMPNKKLVVIGEGSEMASLKAKAKSNTTLLGYQEDHVLIDYMQKAKAFIFAAEEDFGIVPVEAQACGTPVIAYGKGGVLETVQNLTNDSPTGVYFSEQSVSSIIEAIIRFEENANNISAKQCRKNAERFSPDRFRVEYKEYVEKSWNQFRIDGGGYD
jgi:glycosyltransferase involved in cell wall biosynthesis